MKTQKTIALVEGYVYANYHVEKDVLVVVAFGKRADYSIENHIVSIEAYQRVKKVCVELGLKKMLIVSEVLGRIFITELKAMKDHIMRIDPSVSKGIKVVLVDTNYGSYLDNLFVEQTVISKGVEFRVFHDEAKGREWIGL
ncbi:hypothetical protein BXY85_1278 [Roseivirga pacifica]|uniref:SpoIIAA-like n=1 Tax=Roseivirga pacifica TaxID=1267423 RepID=A0A1I0MBS7_9BACT|nr:hypothetical protein [Roseivirga pacifica]RKQ50264.1 hypothetical protein BXY85_1278 [Roseivirga pacifica]SEV85823.1 hypothetical protein SAMN05216290_0262 [Roseivirga pacifica]